MSNKPSSPEPLDYGKGPAPPKNSWKAVILRMLGGIGAAIVSAGVGLILAGATGYWVHFLIPPAVTLGILIYVTVRQRKFGYVSGFILAPFLIALALIILIRIFCGGGGIGPGV